MHLWFCFGLHKFYLVNLQIRPTWWPTTKHFSGEEPAVNQSHSTCISIKPSWLLCEGNALNPNEPFDLIWCCLCVFHGFTWTPFFLSGNFWHGLFIKRERLKATSTSRSLKSPRPTPQAPELLDAVVSDVVAGLVDVSVVWVDGGSVVITVPCNNRNLRCHPSPKKSGPSWDNGCCIIP